jgi:hypothetical protein
VRGRLGMQWLATLLTRNRRALPLQNRDCLRDSKNLVFMDEH